MSTQIAFTLPNSEMKKQLQKQLAAEGLNTKAFFTYCVDAYLAKKIKFWLLPTTQLEDPDRTSESPAEKQAFERSLAGKEAHFSLAEAQQLLKWATK